MATVQTFSNSPRITNTTKETNMSPKTTTKTTKQTSKTDKAPKAKKSAIQTMFGRVQQASKRLGKAVRQLEAWQVADTHEASAMAVKDVVHAINRGDLLGALALLSSQLKDYVPPAKAKKVGASKADWLPGARCYVKAQRREEYEAFFKSTDLDNLYVAKVVGTKVLIQIGSDANPSGDSRRMLGAEPKSHFTLRAPSEEKAAA